MDIFNVIFLNNTLDSWLIALGITLGVFLFLLCLKQILKNRFIKIIKKSKTDVDDFVIKYIKEQGCLFVHYDCTNCGHTEKFIHPDFIQGIELI